MRLIDADKVDFNEVFKGQSDFARDTREAAKSLIDTQSSVYLDTVECKNCGEISVMPDGADYRYCPYCAAKLIYGYS